MYGDKELLEKAIKDQEKLLSRINAYIAWGRKAILIEENYKTGDYKEEIKEINDHVKKRKKEAEESRWNIYFLKALYKMQYGE